MKFKRTLLWVGLWLSAPGGRAETDSFRPMFTGDNFDGWYVVVAGQGRVNEQDIFSIDEGVIRTYPTKPAGSRQPFAGLVTEKEYSRYHLTLEYRWGEKVFAPRDRMVRDAGVMYHVFGDDVIWPDGLECQIQEGDTGDIWAVNVIATSPVQNVIRNYAPQGKAVTRGGPGEPRFARFHRSYCWEVPGWNTVELIVDGTRSRFKVNGHVVNEVTDARIMVDGKRQALARGRILLQAEGAEIFYRHVMIQPLAPGLPD